MKHLLRLLSVPLPFVWIAAGFYLDLALGWADAAIVAVTVPLLFVGLGGAALLWSVSCDVSTGLPSRRERRHRRVEAHRHRLREELDRLSEDDPERAHVEGQIEELNAVEAAILTEEARKRRSALARATRKIVDRETRG